MARSADAPLTALQARIAAFVREHGLTTDPATRLLDLTAEVGELCKAYLEASQYGHREAALTAHWAEELGDVLFALVCLANATDVDLDAALEHVLQKYQTRLEQQGHPGSRP